MASEMAFNLGSPFKPFSAANIFLLRNPSLFSLKFLLKIFKKILVLILVYILLLSNVKKVGEREREREGQRKSEKIYVLKTVSLGWWTKAPLRKIQLLSGGVIIYTPTFFIMKKKQKK